MAAPERRARYVPGSSRRVEYGWSKKERKGKKKKPAPLAALAPKDITASDMPKLKFAKGYKGKFREGLTKEYERRVVKIGKAKGLSWAEKGWK